MLHGSVRHVFLPKILWHLYYRAYTRKTAEESDGSAFFRGAGIETDDRIRWKRHYQREIEGAVHPDIQLAEVLGGDRSDEPVRSNIGPS